MATTPTLPPELERRIALLEKSENQGEDYDAVAWLVLIALGILVPIACLIIGRGV